MRKIKKFVMKILKKINILGSIITSFILHIVAVHINFNGIIFITIILKRIINFNKCY